MHIFDICNVLCQEVLHVDCVTHEGHLVQLPTQETVGSTSLRLPWLCLIKCVEFPAFQIGDTCSSAALLPLGKNVLPNVSCKPPRPQSVVIVPFYI